MPGATTAVSRMGRLAGRLAVVGTVVLGLGGFVLSFTALRDLAVRVGMPGDLAWIWPLLIDGLIIEATLAVVRLSQLRRRSVWYAWSLLAGGAVVSVGSNGVHAVATGHGAAGAAASAVAPVVLLAMTHLTVLLLESPEAAAAQELDDVEGQEVQAPCAPAKEAQHQEEDPRGVPTPEPAPFVAEPGSSAGEAGQGQDEDEGDRREVDLESWVRAQQDAGVKVTGQMVGELLGVSASTGRRRLAELRDHQCRPHLRLAGNK